MSLDGEQRIMYSTVPTDTVSRFVRSNPVSRLDLVHLRDHRDPGRFQSVYKHVHGQRFTANGYRARVFKFFELGSGFATAEDAAKAVVAFYKAHYGERWVRAYQNRKVTPWRVRPLRRADRSPVTGYEVDIYVRGETVLVNEPYRVWPTAQAAKAAARFKMAQIMERELSSLTIPAPGLLFWRN